MTELVTTTVKLPKHLLDALDSFCQKHHMSRSEAVRKAIKMFLQLNGAAPAIVIEEPKKKRTTAKYKCIFCNRRVVSLSMLIVHVRRLHSDLIEDRFCHLCGASIRSRRTHLLANLDDPAHALLYLASVSSETRSTSKIAQRARYTLLTFYERGA